MNAFHSALPRSSRLARAARSMAATLMTAALFGSQFGLAVHYASPESEELARTPSAQVPEVSQTSHQPANAGGAQGS